ncbi:hypothetical protein LINGRAHAP2_LOCUS6024, partial [Linum grandiflorum]
TLHFAFCRTRKQGLSHHPPTCSISSGTSMNNFFTLF